MSATASSPAIPKLSPKERAELIRLLPDEERKWLEEVARPIILPDEETVFLLLSRDHERQTFKEEFWKRREKDGFLYPLGPGYRRRYEELLRLADQKYDGRREDAGRMVIAHGEPAAIDALESCKDMFRDLQIWTYRGTTAGNTGELRYFFYRRSPQAPRKLWDMTVPDGDVFQPGSCRRHFPDLYIDCTPSKRTDADPCKLLTSCPAVCLVLRVYLEISAREGTPLGGRTESASALAPPSIELEGLEALAARSPSIANPQARPIAVEAARGASGQTAVPNPTPTSASTTGLTPEEIRELILRLQPKHREFLDLAGPMFVGNELSRFLQMTDAERDAFIRDFWRQRSR